jgi:hypothetical protein
MPIQPLLADVDGTLLTRDKVLTERARSAIILLDIPRHWTASKLVGSESASSLAIWPSRYADRDN